MTVEKTLPLLLLFFVGCYLRRKRVLEHSDAATFGKLLSNLVIPAMLVDVFSKIEIDNNLIYLPIAALCIVTTLVTIGYFVAHQLTIGQETRGAFVMAFPTFEGGAIGYVFMFSVFGELGLNRIVLFDLANIVFLFTVIYWCSCSFGSRSTRTPAIAAKLARTPLIWAVAIGLILNVSGWHSALLTRILDTIGDSFLLLMMLMLGLRFQFDPACLKLSSLTIVLKTAIGVALGCLAAAMFGLSGVERVAVIVGSALPPSMLTLVYAEENHLDTRYVANLLSMALPFALLFLPVLVHFL